MEGGYPCSPRTPVLNKGFGSGMRCWLRRRKKKRFLYRFLGCSFVIGIVVADIGIGIGVVIHIVVVVVGKRGCIVIVIAIASGISMSIFRGVIWLRDCLFPTLRYSLVKERKL